MAAVRCEAPHRTLGLDQISHWSGLQLDAAAWQASAGASLEVMQKAVRAPNPNAMGMDTITKLLASISLKLSLRG